MHILMHVYMQFTNYNACTICPLGYIITHNAASMLSESEIDTFIFAKKKLKTIQKSNEKNITFETDCALIRKMCLYQQFTLSSLSLLLIYLQVHILNTSRERGSPIGHC